MAHLLDGHLALVTGGGSGIGRGIALAYAGEGARVAVADLDAAGADETRRMIAEAGGTAWSFALDVTDRAACRALAERIRREAGAISVLVNNAGIVRRDPITAEGAAADWDAVLAVNVDGVFNVTHAFLDQLLGTRGRIVNIGSIQSYVHTGNAVAYTVSKGAVLNFTKALAAELGPKGVRVNAIGPGFILTPLNAAAREANPGMIEAFLRHTPLGRAGTPEDIAGPVVFLASDLSRYVTGALIPADGGYLTV